MIELGSSVREPVDELPLRSRSVTLIVLHEGIVEIAKNVGEKRELLQGISEDALVMAAWTGKWSTDVFGPIAVQDIHSVL